MPTKYRLYAVSPRAGDFARRRAAPRAPVYIIAALIFGEDSATPLACTVRDLSESGARLEIDHEGLKPPPTPVELPEQITVHFCPDRTEVDCRVAWREGRHFGVQFLSEIRPATRRLS